MYQRLPARSFRLIEILESPADELHLRLHVHSIDNDVKYDALSYTWGPPLNTPECLEEYDSSQDVEVLLHVNEEQFKRRIGLNLYEALIRIENFDERDPIWIDALCINQQDLEEKTSQIAFMPQIYSKAQCVIVWMGVDESTDEHVVDIHTRVYQQLCKHAQEHGPFKSHEIIVDDGLDFRGSDITISQEALHALYKFYATRRYLSRSWTVQEIVFSRRALVLMGNKLFPIQFLGQMVLIIGNCPAAKSLVQDSSLNSGNGSELSSLTTNRDNFKPGSEAVTRHLHQLFGTGHAAYFGMMYFLLTGPKRYSTDPRDALFSLHGIASGFTDDIPFTPDYRHSVEDVFVDFTTRSFATTFNMLVFARGSWIPDYTDRRRPLEAWCRDKWRREPMFCAADGEPDPVVDGLQLSMWARRCCTIEASFRHGPEAATDIQSLALNALLHIVHALEFLVQHPHSVESFVRVLCLQELEREVLLRRFRHTVLTVLLEAELSFEDLRDRLLDCIKKLPDMPSQQEIDWPISVARDGKEGRYDTYMEFHDEIDVDAIWPMDIKDDVFATDGGHYGRAVDVRPGDEVWLLCGAQVPFVLRPQDGKYQLVAHAFVDGAMYGELLKNGGAGDRQRITLV